MVGGTPVFSYPKRTSVSNSCDSSLTDASSAKHLDGSNKLYETKNRKSEKSLLVRQKTIGSTLPATFHLGFTRIAVGPTGHRIFKVCEAMNLVN